jgi:hypothetical protein
VVNNLYSLQARVTRYDSKGIAKDKVIDLDVAVLAGVLSDFFASGLVSVDRIEHGISLLKTRSYDDLFCAVSENIDVFVNDPSAEVRLVDLIICVDGKSLSSKDFSDQFEQIAKTKWWSLGLDQLIDVVGSDESGIKVVAGAQRVPEMSLF